MVDAPSILLPASDSQACTTLAPQLQCTTQNKRKSLTISHASSTCSLASKSPSVRHESHIWVQYCFLEDLEGVASLHRTPARLAQEHSSHTAEPSGLAMHAQSLGFSPISSPTIGDWGRSRYQQWFEFERMYIYNGRLQAQTALLQGDVEQRATAPCIPAAETLSPRVSSTSFVRAGDPPSIGIEECPTATYQAREKTQDQLL